MKAFNHLLILCILLINACSSPEKDTVEKFISALNNRDKIALKSTLRASVLTNIPIYELTIDSLHYRQIEIVSIDLINDTVKAKLSVSDIFTSNIDNLEPIEQDLSFVVNNKTITTIIRDEANERYWTSKYKHDFFVKNHSVRLDSIPKDSLKYSQSIKSFYKAANINAIFQKELYYDNIFIDFFKTHIRPDAELDMTMEEVFGTVAGVEGQVDYDCFIARNTDNPYMRIVLVRIDNNRKTYMLQYKVNINTKSIDLVYGEINGVPTDIMSIGMEIGMSAWANMLY